jgi:predicted MFS family arabinose efflux permease
MAMRALVACGDALVFTALIKLVSQQFPAVRFGMMSGLSQVSGYIGGIVATTPLAVAVSHFGWRACFAAIAVAIALNLLASAAMLPRPPVARKQSDTSFLALLRRMWLATGKAESWGCGLTFASAFVVSTSLSGVWGMPMLMHAYGLDRTEASTPMLIFMIGFIVGSIGFGYIADRVQSLVRLLIGTCAVRLVLLLLLAPGIGRSLGLVAVTASLGLLGVIAGGTTPLILKCVRRIYTSTHIGLGASINTTLANVVVGAVQPVIGWLLERTWTGQVVDGARAYSPSGYDGMILLLVAISAAGIIGPLMMRKSLGASDAS